MYIQYLSLIVDCGPRVLGPKGGHLKFVRVVAVRQWATRPPGEGWAFSPARPRGDCGLSFRFSPNLFGCRQRGGFRKKAFLSMPCRVDRRSSPVEPFVCFVFIYVAIVFVSLSGSVVRSLPTASFPFCCFQLVFCFCHVVNFEYTTINGARAGCQVVTKPPAVMR